MKTGLFVAGLLVIAAYAASDGVVIHYGSEKTEDWIESREYGGVRLGMSKDEAKSILMNAGFETSDFDGVFWSLSAKGVNSSGSGEEICPKNKTISITLISSGDEIEHIRCHYKGSLNMEGETRRIIDPFTSGKTRPFYVYSSRYGFGSEESLIRKPRCIMNGAGFSHGSKEEEEEKNKVECEEHLPEYPYIYGYSMETVDGTYSSIIGVN